MARNGIWWGRCWCVYGTGCTCHGGGFKNFCATGWGSSSAPARLISLHEAVRAVEPLEEQLVEELQQAALAHADETPWKEWGRLLWLGVIITPTICLYFIGYRRKEILANVFGEGFVGWLMSDGYQVYRRFRQRLSTIRGQTTFISAIAGAARTKNNKWFYPGFRCSGARLGGYARPFMRELAARVPGAARKIREN